MSLPPLPSAFGNYALGDFTEISAPPAISWWPQTSGWWWLAAGLALLALRWSYRRLRHWYRNRYRQEAVVLLTALDAAENNATLAADINRLLKLTALAAFPRQQVAPLSGEAWPAFLNQQCPEPVFSAELGALLALAPYRPLPLDSTIARQLLRASQRWVQEHRNTSDD